MRVYACVCVCVCVVMETRHLFLFYFILCIISQMTLTAIIVIALSHPSLRLYLFIGLNNCGTSAWCGAPVCWFSSERGSEAQVSQSGAGDSAVKMRLRFVVL